MMRARLSSNSLMNDRYMFRFKRARTQYLIKRNIAVDTNAHDRTTTTRKIGNCQTLNKVKQTMKKN